MKLQSPFPVSGTFETFSSKRNQSSRKPDLALGLLTVAALGALAWTLRG